MLSTTSWPSQRPANSFGKFETYSLSALVHRDTVNGGVGSAEKAVFEDIRSLNHLRVDLAEDGRSALEDYHNLTRLDILNVSETKPKQGHGLGGQHIILALPILLGARSNDKAPNAMRISGSNNGKSSNYKLKGIQ